MLEVLTADMEQALERCGEGSDRDRAAPPALLRLLSIVECYRALALQRPHQFGLLSKVLADPRFLLSPEDADEVGQSMGRLLDIVETELAAAVADGALRPGPSRDRCLLLWASSQGLLQMRKLGRLEGRLVALDGLLQELVDSLLRGWGADPEQLEAARATLRGGRS